MEEKKLNTPETQTEQAENTAVEAQTTEEDLHGENLTDRVKVLSPGMVVAKRFFRSKLSLVGLTTLLILFIFSFLGPVFSPWGRKKLMNRLLKNSLPHLL